MESFITTIVVLIQLALAGFVAWGGWLCFRTSLRREPEVSPQAQVDGFERVVSLVLLALLCSTLIGVA
jgi:hypothetical protein